VRLLKTDAEIPLKWDSP